MLIKFQPTLLHTKHRRHPTIIFKYFGSTIIFGYPRVHGSLVRHRLYAGPTRSGVSAKKCHGHTVTAYQSSCGIADRLDGLCVSWISCVVVLDTSTPAHMFVVPTTPPPGRRARKNGGYQANGGTSGTDPAEAGLTPFFTPRQGL